MNKRTGASAEQAGCASVQDRPILLKDSANRMSVLTLDAVGYGVHRYDESLRWRVRQTLLRGDHVPQTRLLRGIEREF